MLKIGTVEGLTPNEQKDLNELVEVFNYHESANEIKARYYEGHIRLSEVNLGIAIPKTFQNLEIGCEWGRKCVDVLAARSMFDGFVGANGETNEELLQIMSDNRFISEYMKARKDELKFGCTFATLSADEDIRCKIRFHSPKTSAALWNGAKGRIDRGLAIIDSVRDESENSTWIPARINMYNDEAIIVLEYDGRKWNSTKLSHKMGRPLMEPLIWNPTSDKPLGTSRIKEPIRRLIQGYVRTIANATIGLEFATSPQKYLLGVTDDQFDKIINDKFRQYVGSILAATANPESGEKPTFGQLQQGHIAPHVEMLRMLATQFSAATGLSVTDTGVVNDANPTSSEAILAQTQTLVLMAEQLNAANGDSLRVIAQMALAIANDTTMENLDDQSKNIIAHFKNPAMPSITATADAAIKIASARASFADTDTFLEMIGFGQADVRRIKAQEQRSRGMLVLEEEFNDENIE